MHLWGSEGADLEWEWRPTVQSDPGLEGFVYYQGNLDAFQRGLPIPGPRHAATVTVRGFCLMCSHSTSRSWASSVRLTVNQAVSLPPSMCIQRLQTCFNGLVAYQRLLQGSPFDILTMSNAEFDFGTRIGMLFMVEASAASALAVTGLLVYIAVCFRSLYLSICTKTSTAV